MKKSVFVVFAILMLVLPSVMAVQINAKTLKGLKVVVFLKEQGGFNVLDMHQGIAEEGIVSFESGFSNSDVDLVANVVNANGDYIVSFKKENVDATGLIELYLPSDDGSTITTSPLVEEDEEESEEVVDEEEAEDEEGEEVTDEEIVGEDDEETEEVVEEVVEEGKAEAKEEDNTGVTGKAIGDGIKGIFTSKTSFYIIAAIVAIFAILLVVHRGRNSIGKSKDGSIKIRGDDSRLDAAERKLAEARKELDDIKNRKKKLADAKEKFEKDKEELRKLEGGD